MPMIRNSTLDKAFGDARKWQPEAEVLREILLKSGLDEELKWGKPCYSHEGKNICIIQRMNDFLALMFFKGGLMQDPDGVLEVQGPNSRSGYRMRFTCVADVAKLKKSLNACIREAIRVEKAGLKLEKPDALELPDELVAMFDEDAALRAAFGRLTPGRQRGYIMHFASARQSKTRVARIEKCKQNILDGKGMQDRN